MTLCPVAIVIGCSKCPIFKACPVKGVIGDYKEPVEVHPPAKKATAGKKRKK